MIKVNNLTCVRGDRLLFTNLSLSLSPGQLLHIKGANGSGKTTLLRAICGLFIPQQGDILWNDANIDSLDEDYRREFFYLGHLNGIKDDLNALENLAISNRLNNNELNNEQICDALGKMGLAGFEELPTKMLSQGQKRRVALTHLLLNSTPLWILDEPFVALDTNAVQLLQSVIADKLQNGGLVLLTTHQEVALPTGEIYQLQLGTAAEAAG
ncbi:MAG: cytochrome c biogenesis heme-transporting ATPase CcmA [Acidiferrobacterales bacterium]